MYHNTDTRSTEEILAANKDWRYDRTGRNGTRYFYNCRCPRCGGAGYIEYYKYIQNGECFECGGSGVAHNPAVEKVYTPEYAAKLEKQEKARAAKQEAARTAKLITTRAARLKEAGFGQEDGEKVEWVIYRVVGNTYSIKDQLKAAGCRFRDCVGWYYSSPLSGYDCQRLTEEEVLSDKLNIIWKDREEVAPLWEENIHPVESTSEWIGTIKQRLEFNVHVDSVISGSYSHNYGGYETVSYLVLMSDAAGNVLKWSTNSPSVEEGNSYHIRATIKDHAEYKGVKQTVVTRCAVIG